jgi:hypothetical protein
MAYFERRDGGYSTYELRAIVSRPKSTGNKALLSFTSEKARAAKKQKHLGSKEVSVSSNIQILS